MTGTMVTHIVTKVSPLPAPVLLVPDAAQAPQMTPMEAAQMTQMEAAQMPPVEAVQMPPVDAAQVAPLLDAAQVPPVDAADQPPPLDVPPLDVRLPPLDAPMYRPRPATPLPAAVQQLPLSSCGPPL